MRHVSLMLLWKPAFNIVLSSVDRGHNSTEGFNRSCRVPVWNTKHHIEAHLRQRIAAGDGKPCTYTIIGPVFSLDNLAPNFFGRLTATWWDSFLQGKPLRVIDTMDVGNFAAQALLDPTSPRFANAEVNLAGDVLTFDQANKTFYQRSC
ncbi:hypothetical protein NA57DRAFT_72579 [Rhizodiscina lignyota]|uniref:NmrA-like domain-containing protein n=1 Tax=Rhizodiscina lignyota TaxID=1504668 RepID=A0A9P4MAT5_9PEZI|nr:hypothetical protein NA57DRAFT_72579 [Rhizodiscina lignyota]